MAEASAETAATYTNPVYDGSFPDPFVLKHRGEYFAYSTGMAPDGRVFGVLRSQDLVSWTVADGAMEPLSEFHPHYWAPEVTYHNGKFYLYYSVGNETLMEIRVAISDAPDGIFVDSGRRLTTEEFAIDPHVVRNPFGNWYMFYATDFLTHTHIGTGTVVDRMTDPFTLAGDPRPVTRARYDWQVYDPARKEKGGVRWHTVEGPFVLERKGIYYQMFSGGNWQNESYGVSFAASETLERDDEWLQFADGTTTQPILRTIPGRILGPGHNSVVLGPNNRELYCVYHRWNENGRVLSIDRMDFAGGARIFVTGPTDSPQPSPYLPHRLTDFDVLDSGGWEIISGEWLHADGRFTSGGTEIDEITHEIARGTDFHCEIGFSNLNNSGTFGIRLKSVDIDVFDFEMDTVGGQAWAEWPGSGGKRPFKLPFRFDPRADHRLAVDLERETVRLVIDNAEIETLANLPTPPSAMALFSAGARAEFGPVDLTIGFEELFQVGDIVKRGWDFYSNRGTIAMENGLLRMEGRDANTAILTRNVPAGDFELCINLRFAEPAVSEYSITFGCGNTFTLASIPELDADGQIFRLPDGYEPTVFNQFRMIRSGTRAHLFLESVHICTVPATDGEFVRIAAQNGVIELEMVRFTAM
jgi:GH43 family beta-xylosidase